MARRKSKKQSKDNARPASGPAAATSVESAPQPEKTAAAKGAPAPKQAPFQPKTKGMRVSSCVGAMFLTFILGLYLGSLMPGIIADIKKGPLPAQVETAPAPQASAPPPAPAPKPAARAVEMPRIPAEMGTRITELESIVSKKDQNVAALIELGNLYFDTHQPRKAIAAYSDALAISPNNADVLTDMGIMYREDGEYAAALDCFRKAIAINPAHQNAMYNEGVVLMHDLKRPEEARDAWKRLLGVNPDARAPDGKFVRDMVSRPR